ncbi:MAG TPA: hypothetical protein VGL60_04580 [Acidimicrobiales bacterium]|jgi:hypothetical protein
MEPEFRCPSCDAGWPDEYTHADCPEGSVPSDHRHLVCFHCGEEWVVAIGPVPRASVSGRRIAP